MTAQNKPKGDFIWEKLKLYSSVQQLLLHHKQVVKQIIWIYTNHIELFLEAVTTLQVSRKKGSNLFQQIMKQTKTRFLTSQNPTGSLQLQTAERSEIKTYLAALILPVKIKHTLAANYKTKSSAVKLPEIMDV